MSASIHSFFEQAITALEKYETDESDSDQQKAAREQIASYREALRDPEIDDETLWTTRLLGLMQDLEAIVRRASPSAKNSTDSLKQVIQDLEASVQGP